MAPPVLNHTMFRSESRSSTLLDHSLTLVSTVKDAKVSLDFYTRVLGMELRESSSPTLRFLAELTVRTSTVDEAGGSDFTNYFLAFPEAGKENLSAGEFALCLLKSQLTSSAVQRRRRRPRPLARAFSSCATTTALR